MLLHRRTAILSLTIWCLLISWLCFGVLELLEQVNLMPEVADLDEAALLQLASGLKSDVPSLDAPYNIPLAKMVHSPPSLRLHQQLSVYRI
ncbi:MAG: hypothetical protein E6K65_08115 [Nitrospirae bacterium]|nr:MAG: hypothetical protein E6K65_08115 [Nitrospirota bacterium]